MTRNLRNQNNFKRFYAKKKKEWKLKKQKKGLKS